MSAPNDREALENSLAANPDDRAAFAAYADWLMEHGDPRGEFIQVQLALEDETAPPAQRKEWQRREKELLDQHQREWLGAIAPFILDQTEVTEQWRRRADGDDIGWARGWLDNLVVTELSVGYARALACAPEARLLRRLAIQTNIFFEEDELEPDVIDNPTVHPLQYATFLPCLRVLEIGERFDEEVDRAESCCASADGVVDLLSRTSNLEELYLLAHHVDTARLFRLKSLTRLRILRLDHLHQYPLKVLATNPAFGQLTHLSCWPHGLDDDDAYIRLPQLRAILQSTHLKSLTHLRLQATDVGDAGCGVVVQSGALSRLKTLALDHGCITDAGARVLAASPDLRRLEYLDVSHNALTADGIVALQATGIKVRTDGQYSERDIRHRMHLFAGDPE